MEYKKQIDSELRQIARRVPYNRGIIKCANIFQAISFHLTMVSKDVSHRNITIKGYRGLKIRVDIFEPANRKEKLPCLIPSARLHPKRHPAHKLSFRPWFVLFP